MDLRVDLASFQGPLDLLLHLVQQEEVDVYEIHVARIADRFLEVCEKHVDTLDVDAAGDYLVMASQLLLLKSRALLPRESEVDLEDIDPRLDLVRQLLEYRDVKEVARILAERATEEAERADVRARGADRPPRSDESLEVDLYALVSAFQRLLRETGDDAAVVVPRERLPITHFVELMFDRLAASPDGMGFRELIGEATDRAYVIGAFLALLELIKLRKVLVSQEPGGEINVQVRAEGLEVEDAVERDLATETIDRPEMGEGRKTRIVVMGSPAFAVPSLQSLVGASMSPLLVVTPPARPSGRGRRRRDVALALEAERLQLPVHRTGDVNGRTSREAIEETTPDVIITAGFGQKLGNALLDLPRRRCINLHASLLPKYRGASPVAAALRDGATETGVTIFVMEEKMDTGPIVAAQALPLTGEETADEVMTALGDLAADLLIRTLPGYLEGAIEPEPQDHEQATYAKRLTKEDGHVPWAKPAVAVKNHVRAVTSWPGAQTAWQPKVKHEPLPLVLLQVAVLDAEEEAGRPEPTNGDPAARRPEPGEVVAAGPEGIDVACGQGVLRILRLKPAGGRPLSVQDFYNARRVRAGDRFV